MNQLDQLKRLSTIAAESADFTRIGAFAPDDVATNPSLILQAAQQPEHAPLLHEVIAAHNRKPLDKTLDELQVRFGVECLRVVPGRVSTEIDARLSFDTGATIARAQRIVELYNRAGIARERVLIEIAASWEGVQAAKALEHQGIRCNLTLVFSLCQAVACGEAGVSVISPFVGRIADWHRQAPAADDAGVQLVTRIYSYFKKFGLGTAVMAANLRSTAQVAALAGCDLLAIDTELLSALQAAKAPIERRLDADAARSASIHALVVNEAGFRYALNDDSMATEKLAQGIRAFAADTVRLEQLVGAAA